MYVFGNIFRNEALTFVSYTVYCLHFPENCSVYTRIWRDVVMYFFGPTLEYGINVPVRLLISSGFPGGTSLISYHSFNEIQKVLCLNWNIHHVLQKFCFFTSIFNIKIRIYGRGMFINFEKYASGYVHSRGYVYSVL